MNLVPLEAGALQAFLDVALSKEEPRKTKLLALRSRVKRLFWTYHDHRRDLAGLPRSASYSGDRDSRMRMRRSHAYRHATKKEPPPGSSFTEDAQEVLSHCYKPTVSRDALLEAIRAYQSPAARRECQYCCGVGRAHTWDHYIGQKQFPEFAIYAPNLVPACGECNTIKGETWMKYGRRSCIHFYYDRFNLRLRFIEATIDIGADGDPDVSFFLAQGRIAATRFGRLLARHWRMLQLERRLRQAAEAKLSVIAVDIAQLARLVNCNVDSIGRELASKASALARLRGANHFEAVLFRAAAASRPLIEYYLRQVPR